MRQVLRGPNGEDFSSVLRHNSLLEDLYGHSSVEGWILSEAVFQPTPGAWDDPKDYQTANMQYMPELAYYPTNNSLEHAKSISSGQIIEFIAGYTVPQNADTGGYSGGSFASTTKTFPEDFGTEGEDFPRHVGKILTIRVPGAYYNKSTRIIGYRREEVDDGGAPPKLEVVYHYYQILPFEGIGSTDTQNAFRSVSHEGHDFIINGAPFSGAGAGYDTTTRTNDAEYGTDYPYALLPNPTDPDYHTDSNSELSANEDYDAPDYQNMLLAMEHHDGTAMTLTRSPSLHRPALANYWLHRLATTLQGSPYSLTAVQAWQVLARPGLAGSGSAVETLVLRVKRRCLLRPLSEDHSNFDGSNANWANENSSNYEAAKVSAITDIGQLQAMARRAWGAANLVPGVTTLPWLVDTNNDGLPPDLNGNSLFDEEIVPWDVDNDGDGIPDSIWVDIGLPVRSLPDGRKYRPLVAIHCIDLDGRINLNTAGSVEQLYSAYDSALAAADYLADNTVYAQDLTAGSTPSATPDLLRGQGAGTAEISPLPVLYNSSTVYQNLLRGDTSKLLDGRYGELRRRAAAAAMAASELRWPAPGFTPENYAYYQTATMKDHEKLMQDRFPGYPTNYYDAITNNTALAYGLSTRPQRNPRLGPRPLRSTHLLRHGRNLLQLQQRLHGPHHGMEHHNLGPHGIRYTLRTQTRFHGAPGRRLPCRPRQPLHRRRTRTPPPKVRHRHPPPPRSAPPTPQCGDRFRIPPLGSPPKAGTSPFPAWQCPTNCWNNSACPSTQPTWSPQSSSNPTPTIPPNCPQPIGSIPNLQTSI